MGNYCDYKEGKNSHVDKKDRLYLPKKLGLDFPNIVFVSLDKNNCVEIYFNPPHKKAYPLKISKKKGKKQVHELLAIPKWLMKEMKNSPSFIFGKDVKILKKGQHLLVVPRKEE